MGVVFMSNMYNKIDALCKEKESNITAMCKELSIPRSCLSELGQGRSKSLSAKHLNKIADFFRVSVGYLIGEEEQAKKEPLPENEERLNKALKMIDDLSDSEYMAFESFIAGLKANRKQD